MCIVGASLLAQVNSRRKSEIPSGEVSVTSLSGTPSKEYIYAGGRLVATEEPAGGGGCGGSPGTPGPPTATANNPPTSVAIHWPASSGTVDHYQVERKQTLLDSGYQVVIFNVPPASPVVSTTDSTVIGNTAYVYRVQAFLDAAGNCPSAYSNIDLATTVIFTEDPLVGKETTIKALHIAEVRQAVDAVRTTAGIGGATWTNPLNHLDQVRAVDFSELRNRLNEGLSQLGLSPISGDSTIAPLNIVFATQLQIVRDKVK